MLYNLQAFFCQHQKVFQAVLQEEGWPHLDSLLTRCVVNFYQQYRYCSHLWSANGEQQWQRRQRKRQKISKTATFHVRRAFFYISFPSLHDFDVKLRNFTFCWGREHKTTTFFSFFKTFLQSFRILIQLQKNMPCNIWRIERDGRRAIKFEAGRIHFYCVVFTAVAVVVA